MDEPKLKTFLFKPRGRIGADAAPIAVDGTVVAPSPARAGAVAKSLTESSHVVYSGSEQEVSEGFAIALRLMRLKQSR